MAAEENLPTNTKKSSLLLSIGSREYRKMVFFWIANTPYFNMMNLLGNRRWFKAC